jgi:hypothetical protein
MRQSIAAKVRPGPDPWKALTVQEAETGARAAEYPESFTGGPRVCSFHGANRPNGGPIMGSKSLGTKSFPPQRTWRCDMAADQRNVIEGKPEKSQVDHVVDLVRALPITEWPRLLEVLSGKLDEILARREAEDRLDQ